MIIGDSSALVALYNHLNSDFLLIDDKRAKEFAKLNNVNVIGSLGVLLLAKEQGIVTSIGADLKKLRDSDVFVSESLLNRVLVNAGE